MAMGMMGGAPMPPAPMDPSMPPMMAPPDPNAMMLDQIQALMQKWASGQLQIAGEQAALSDTLMMLLQSSAPTAAQAFSEPGIGASMMGPPMDDVGMGGMPMGGGY